MTQLRLAALAKVSRSTVVRFELNSGDIQLSSALRILSVLDMVEGKQEGNLLLRREGQTLDGPIVAMFAPYYGPREVQWNRNTSVAFKTLHHSSRN